MHDAIADEFSVGKAWNHAEHPLLFAPFQMGLETYQIIHGIVFIILAKLHHGIGISAGSGIRQAHRFHGPEAHGVFSPGSHDLDRHAAFENFFIFKAMDRCHFRLAESFPESLVFFLIHGAVQVSRFAFIVAGHAVHHVHIQGVFRHNGSSGIVEMKSFTAAEIFNIFCQSPFGQRPCGNNDDALPRDGSHFLFHKGHQRMVFHQTGHFPGVSHAVYGQSTPGRHLVAVGRLHND